MRALQATPSTPLLPVFSYEDKGNSKGPAPDCEEMRAAQDRSPNEVIETLYPTLVYIFYINFARHKDACKVEKDRLLEKEKISVEIEKGSLAQGGAGLSPVHKERNPEVKIAREIENGSSPVRKERNPEATSARVIGRGLRKTGDTEEVAISETVKCTKMIEVTERRGGTANIEGRNTKREKSKADAKSKLQMLSEEPKREEQKNLTKRDNSAIRGVTGSRNDRAQKCKNVFTYIHLMYSHTCTSTLQNLNSLVYKFHVVVSTIIVCMQKFHVVVSTIIVCKNGSS